MNFVYSAFGFNALLICLCLVPQVSSAQERILSYHSIIDIAEDASMLVTESIRVQVEGDVIRRGIYRDFPTRYEDRYGNNYRVEFEVLSVLRDGAEEPWRSEERSNGVGVYIGSPEVLLPSGEYTYTILYQTNRQIGYFDDHDELYWNVNGNGWDFAVEQASAVVNLPQSVAVSQLAMEGYTGMEGETGQAYQASLGDGVGTIETTSPLSNYASLTLVMSWPKGIVAEPDSRQRLIYLLADNLGLLLSLLTCMAVAVYLFFCWLRYGKDPEAGVVFPHYNPPKGYSPASARYISIMAYDAKVFTAAVVNLAVKGYLIISKEGKEYGLTRSDSNESLAPGEKALFDTLLESRETLILNIENYAKVSAARSAHKKALRQDYLNIYFAKNSKLLWPSILGSIAMLVLIALLGAFVPLVVAIFVLIAILHIIFAFLLKAPSTKGRLLMDKLDGFKLYLEVAEKDDLKLRYQPDLTPQLFERYLPFAIALGVEQAWAERFNQIFASLHADQGIDYRPLWYAGTFHHGHMAAFSSDVSGSFSNAIASAAAAPGTSSGVGGGFSGGGGGGGGGGGW